MTTIATKERPILFSAPMVRAILDGRKTMTRRVVSTGSASIRSLDLAVKRDRMKALKVCPYGQPGDRLWVRETWAASVFDPEGGSLADDPENWDIVYRASGKNESNWTSVEVVDGRAVTKPIEAPWRPSIHMPRWVSRINLEITEVRAEPLHRIHHNLKDLEAEGFELPPSELYPSINRADKLERVMEKTWNALNGRRGYSWDSNPWVWVVSFKRV